MIKTNNLFLIIFSVVRYKKLIMSLDNYLCIKVVKIDDKNNLVLGAGMKLEIHRLFPGVPKIVWSVRW